MNKEVRVYTPESYVRRPRLLLGEMWRDLMRGRDLGRRLAIRDFRAQFRQSIIGILWIFILPLSNTLTWLFLRSSGVVSIAETELPYPIYVFTGTMLWSILTESIQGPLQKVTANKSLLSKINFPREALLLSSIYQSISKAGIKVLLMIVGMIGMGYNFLDIPFIFFPLGILSLILVGTAVGILLVPVGLLYNDIGKGLPILMQFLMYLSPVVFAVPKMEWITMFVAYNPLTPMIVTSRAWMTGKHPILLHAFIEVNLVFFVLLFIGCVIYRIAMPILIERMSS